MPWTTVGRELLAEALMGTRSFDDLTLEVGVGDGNAAFDVGQVDLQGANTLRKGMLGGFPSRANNEITLAAEFLRAEANWEWHEWGLFDDAGNMYFREVEFLDEKTSAHARIFYPVIEAGEV